MATYTERAFNVSDEDEIKRIREYIAALKKELARVRSLDPVEFWFDEIGRIQRLIDRLLDYPKNERPPEQTSLLGPLEEALDNALEQLEYWQSYNRKPAWIQQTIDQLNNLIAQYIDDPVHPPVPPWTYDVTWPVIWNWIWIALEAWDHPGDFFPYPPPTTYAELVQRRDEQVAKLALINDSIAYWQSEIIRLEKEIDAILVLPPTQGLTEAEQDKLTQLYGERADAIERYRIARAPKRDGKMRTDPTAWEDITGQVVWNETSFTQLARTGPGNFTVVLRGAHGEFRSGEEIRVSIDDLVTFGGWVTSKEQGHFFTDSPSGRTTLYGTDYNALFDRLAMRNYPWEASSSYTAGRMMLGPYRSWPDFPQGTLDQDMIDVVFGEYLLPDLPMGFDYTNHVDAVDTPAPVAPWTMPQAGSPVRRFMQSVSQITSAVWSIDATMALQYHDREVVSAPYPITDGLGGISSRGLSISTDIGSMVNDVLVWGTLARTVEGEIMVWHEEGDIGFWERYYLGLINRTQKLLNKLLAIKPSKRTAKQRKAIKTYQSRIATYKTRLEDARARSWDPLSGLPRPKNAIVNSIDTWGRWQMGEFRQDIHHQEWLERRGHSILTRFDEPIIKATATVWDPGYQAGQVVRVRSAEHGVDVNLAVRQIKLSFSVSKEPHDGKFYALPRYDLEMGLDPESPWNIYDYIPYPGESTPGLGGDTTGG